jgi:hypothetical protein
VGQRGNDQEQPDGGEGEADGQSGAGAETAEQGEQDDHDWRPWHEGFGVAAVPVEPAVRPPPPRFFLEGSAAFAVERCTNTYDAPRDRLCT